MDEAHIEVSRQHAARVTETTDPDVARMIAEDLPAEESGGAKDLDAVFEKLLRELRDGASD